MSKNRAYLILATLTVVAMSLYQNCGSGFTVMETEEILPKIASVEVPLPPPGVPVTPVTIPLPTTTTSMPPTTPTTDPGTTPTTIPTTPTTLPPSTPTLTVTLSTLGNVRQGSNLQFEIRLSSAVTVPLQVTYQTIDSTGVASVDYVSTNGSLTIPAGTVSITIPVPTLSYAVQTVVKNVGLKVTIDAGAGKISTAAVGVIDPAAAVAKFKTGTSGSWEICLVDMQNKVVCFNASLFEPKEKSGVFPEDKLALGGNHGCALTPAGKVKCWGYSPYGELGNGSLDPKFNSPVTEVPGLSGVKSIAGQYNTTCVILADDSVKCWGNGQAVPKATALTNVKVIEASYLGKVCAVLHSGETKCLDFAASGTNPSKVDGPIKSIANATSLVSISGGQLHHCGITNSRTVKCWGDKAYGQLGNGVGNTGNDFITAVDVPGLTNVKELKAGANNTCALKDDGTVWCWGDANAWLPAAKTSHPPVTVPTAIPGISGIQTLLVNHSWGCGLTTQGSLKCWGAAEKQFSPVALDVIGATDFVSVAANYSNACGVTSVGGVKCWGKGNEGQLGNGAMDDSSVAVGVIGLLKVKSLSIGTYMSCVITDTNNVKCWGGNSAGALGNGTTVDSAVPVDVQNLGSVKTLALGHRHTCAISSQDNTVKCWGLGRFGELGNGVIGNSSVPVDVVSLGAVRAIAASGNSTCAITPGETVKCWGSYIDQSHKGPEALPIDMPSLSNIKLLVGGMAGYCAVDSQYKVYCWDGTTLPTQVPNVGAVKSITVGTGFYCALSVDNKVRCWGRNAYFVFGSTKLPDSLTGPTSVFIAENIKAIAGGMGITYLTGRNTARQTSVHFVPPNGERLSPLE